MRPCTLQILVAEICSRVLEGRPAWFYVLIFAREIGSEQLKEIRSHYAICQRPFLSIYPVILLIDFF